MTSSPFSRIAPERRREAAADQVEQRRLAGAVRADDRVPLALGTVEVDAADDLRRAETLVRRH